MGRSEKNRVVSFQLLVFLLDSLLFRSCSLLFRSSSMIAPFVRRPGNESSEPSTKSRRNSEKGKKFRDSPSPHSLLDIRSCKRYNANFRIGTFPTDALVGDSELCICATYKHAHAKTKESRIEKYARQGETGEISIRAFIISGSEAFGCAPERTQYSRP